MMFQSYNATISSDYSTVLNDELSLIILSGNIYRNWKDWEVPDFTLLVNGSTSRK